MTRLAASVAPIVIAAAVAALTGCLEVTTVTCADGRLCPAGTRCDDLHARCVFPDQLESCLGVPDGERCTVGGEPNGVCVDQVCLRESCGDGLVTGAEQCDGPLPVDFDCTDLGYYERGPVGCNLDCTFDRSGCAHLCGDDVIDLGRESCDGDAVAAATNCQHLGYYDSAPLACNAACRYDVSGCTGECGDGIRNGPEACEGGPPPGTQCAGFGYDAGVPRCSTLCAADLAGCTRFGWTREAAMAGANDVAFAGQIAYAVHDRIERRPPGGGDWEFDDQGVPHLPLHGVWAASPTAIYAVGLGGTILRSDGQAWQPMTSPTTANLLAVWGRSATDVYAVGDGVVLHYDGQDWVLLAELLGALRAIGGTPDDLWVAGDLVHHFDGNGWSWEDPFYPEGVTAIAIHPDGVLFGTTGGLHRRDAVGGWARLRDEPTQDLVMFGPDRIAIASAGSIRFHDGRGWSAQQLSTATITALAGAGPGDLIAVDGQGVVFHGDGLGVDRQPTGVVADLRGVWAQGGNGFAVGDGGAIVALIDGRWSLTATASTTTANLRAVWGSAPDDVVAVGAGGTILHWNGSAWQPMTGAAGDLRAVWGSGPQDVYAVGDGGAWRYRGATWSPVTVGPPGAAWSGVWGTGPDDVYVTGGAGTYHWNGASWTVSELPGGASLDGAAGLAGAVLAIVNPEGWWEVVRTAEGGAVRRVGNNATFQRFADAGPITPLPRITDLAIAGPADVFASLDNGALAHFDGVAWTQIRTGVLSPLRAIAEDGASVWLVGDGGALLRVSRWASPAEGCPRAGAELACDDGADDDCDLLVDDRDPDCSAAGVCWGAPDLGCGESLTRTVDHSHVAIATTACDSALREGPEQAYRIATSSPATITVTALPNSASVQVVAETSAGACDPAGGCLATGFVDGSGSATLATKAGSARYVIVHGGTYTITVACP